MKKVLSLVLACTLLLGCVLIFASCGGLKGTYEYTSQNIALVLTFSGNKVTQTTPENKDLEVVGSYEIKDDKIIITYEEYKYSGNDSTMSETLDILNATLKDSEPTTYSFEKGDGYIIIDGLKYEKK